MEPLVDLTPDFRPSTTTPLQSTPRWKKSLANVVRDPAELCKLLHLSDIDAAELGKACADFPLRVPRGFVDRMTKGSLSDPLLRQVLPDAAELVETQHYSTDPLDELDANTLPGLLHKYTGRVLITLTSSCAVHCRYCFRRHFAYGDNRLGDSAWQNLLDYIERDTSITEVILSGGDPLNLPDSILVSRVADIERIAHVTRLRLHTRQPVVLPERIDDTFLSWLGKSRLNRVMVIHANHANELDHSVEKALRAVASTGTTLLNQSVLLDGVNNDANTLVALSERLFTCGVLPYYLHLPDRVQGTAHFHVSDERAHQLQSAMQARLPGYLVPKLAREVAGESSKQHL